jgi:MFS family permease
MAPRIARALRHRNYRLFFTGQAISLIGTWLTRFATVWMVYRLTHSGVLLGLVGFCSQAPASLCAPIAGVLVDRWNRHRVIVVTQICAMLQSAVLALFAFTGWMQVWHLCVLGAVQGLINAFDMPARQSFLGQMIDDRADLPNAVALNSSIVNGARLLGPVFAAELVAWFGEGWCFAIDAASYIAVITSLLLMRVTPHAIKPRSTHVWTEMKEGWRYVGGMPLVRAVLLLLLVSSTVAGSYTTLLPLVVGEPHGLGIVMGAGGLGALCGAIYLASRSTIVGLGGVLVRCGFGLGLAMMALRIGGPVWVIAPIVLGLGACLMVQMAATNTIVQTVVDSDKLGRVMSLYAIAFWSGTPIGALLEGALADQIGAGNTFLVAGMVALVSAIVFWRTLPKLRASTRALYVRLGLVEDI